MTKHFALRLESGLCICICICSCVSVEGAGTNAHLIIIQLKRLGIIMTNKCRDLFFCVFKVMPISG